MHIYRLLEQNLYWYTVHIYCRHVFIPTSLSRLVRWPSLFGFAKQFVLFSTSVAIMLTDFLVHNSKIHVYYAQTRGIVSKLHTDRYILYKRTTRKTIHFDLLHQRKAQKIWKLQLQQTLLASIVVSARKQYTICRLRMHQSVSHF